MTIFRSSIFFFSVRIAPVSGWLVLVLMVPVSVVHATDDIRSMPRNTIYYSSPPSAKDIGQHLFPSSAYKGLSRSITLKDSREDILPDRSVSMPVLFHFGKTTIVEQSRAFLDSVGQMLLQEEYATRTLIVEGHTDAVGSESSNQRLSELRALAIKDYLVTRYGIDPYRLFPTGQGESMLSKPSAPTDGANRRVEFLPYQSQQ